MQAILEKECNNCGEILPIENFDIYGSGNWTRGECKQCRNIKRAEYNRNHPTKRRPIGSEIGGPWRIITDPDESWGTDSSLTMREINALINAGYVCPGLKVKHEKTGTIRTVIQSEGILKLR